MLTDFFKLNGTPQAVTSADSFIECLNARIVENLQLTFDPLKLSRPSNRIVNKTFRNVSFSHKAIENIEFTACVFEDCLFINTDLINCRFKSCTFIGCNPYRMQIAGTYLDPKCFTKAFNYRNDTNIAIDFFEQLLNNSRERGLIDFVPVAEFNYRKWKRYRLLYYRPANMRLSKWVLRLLCRMPYISLQYIWEITTGYGCKIGRFATSSLVALMAIFVFNFEIWDRLRLSTDEKIIHQNDPATVFYFTIMLMSTLGMSSINPQTQGGIIVVGLEALAGPLWIGILAALIVKKTIR